MTALARTFVIRGPENAATLHAFLKQNAASMAEQGQPLEVRVTVWKPRASDEQRALIWVINEQIAQQAWIGGRRFDAETWHEQCKRELLPEESKRGVQKWRVLANGERVLHMSTENLDRHEKSEYLQALLAFAGSLGVDVAIQAARE
jgi:hypothetical protein